jgi:hypothetical protein
MPWRLRFVVRASQGLRGQGPGQIKPWAYWDSRRYRRMAAER